MNSTNYYDYGFANSYTKCECVIDGVRQTYDACSGHPLDEAIAFYSEHFDYIGSGTVCYYNGVKNEWPVVHHFFNRKP